MPLSSDTSAALSLLERIQRGMKESEETRLTAQCSNDLNTLISVLESPIFRGIINIQDSLKELKRQVSQHPSIVPTDFDITKEGRLVLHLATVAAPLLTPLPPQFDNEDALPTEALESIELQELNLEKKSVELERENDVSTVIGVEGDEEDGGGVIGGGEEEEEEEEDDEELSKRHHLHHHHHPNVITNVTMDQELERAIDAAAQGREIHYIQLYKTEGSTLGFSVVGLRSEQRGELGIYVQQIQPTGIAAQDGRLEEGDQILAIDGQVLDSYISHQQAIGILQKATRLVELVVARAPPLEDKQPPQPPLTADPTAAPLQQQPPPTAVTDLLPPITPQDAATTPVADMLNTEWAQVEVIELVNDGSGLGFGIIGGRSTGVVVKTILPGGVADRDGRLQSGDHILQIGEVNLRGLGSDQVAVVLRQAGSHVRLVVARPIDPSSPDLHLRQVGRSAPIVETRVLNDPEELERRLSVLHNGYTPIAAAAAAAMQSAADAEAEAEAAAAAAAAATNGHAAPHYTNGEMDAGTREKQQLVVVGEGGATITTEAHLHYQQVEVEGVSSSSSLSPPLVTETQPKEGGGGGGEQSTSYGEENLGLLTELPEMENIELEITKDLQGLGITIAGYVCEQEELSGIFVKSINAGSAADRNGHIQVNDQIVQVDGRSLGGLSNHAAVDVLRGTGQVVRLRLARYLRGPKYEQLQQAIANSELKTTPTTPNPPRAPLGEAASSDALRSALGELEQTGDEETVEAINPSLHISSVVMPPLHPASTTIIADVPILPSTSTQPLLPSHYTTVTTTDVPELSSPPAALDVPPSDTRLEDIELMIDSNYSGEMPASVDAAINLKWSRIVGSEFDIVVAQLSKFEEGGGLGISLEGTVDVEGGREVRPHHYIRSILPDGPVGKNGRLCSGDELLEVNGQKLLGLNHVEVVGILKELPRCVRLVCGRRAPGAPLPLHPIDAPTANRDTFAARNILGGSLQNLLPGSERLVKAKSDGSLASSSAAATPDAALSRMKSRSLEPLTGLAMWSSECQVIELTKGDRGLGFSILDYQDPLNPQETVIVIRSLVPGGVAEKDGRLIPGDRLVAVNGTNLENATLDQAVAALKGAPRGTVSIAVAKPISVLESTGQDRTPDSDDPTVSFPRRSLLDAILGEHGGPGDGGGEEVDHSDRGSVDLSDRENNIYDLEDEELSEGQVYRHKHSDSVVSSELPPLPPSSPPLTPAFPTTDEDEDEDDQVTEYDNQRRCVGAEDGAKGEDGVTSASHKPPPHLTLHLTSPTTSLQPPTDTHAPGEVVSPINVYKASVLMVPVATERLIGSAPAHHHHHHHATTSSTLVSQGSTGDEEGSSPQSSPQLPRWTPTPSLPRHLERTIKIKKGADQMGVNIEVVDQGVNGVVVSSLVRNGAVHKDGRLHAGDLILSVNNESMRNITNSQARAILRRTQLVSTDVSILFIRGQDAAAYREASLLQYREGQQLQQQQQPHGQQQQHQTSPRSPYVPRGESSEDETTGEVGTDLTRSITAPSFITGDIPSRDPSQDDLLGSLASLQAGHHHPQAKSEGLSVISIKHALSETLVESRTEDPNVSSVHIDSETREAEDGEEGPFTITFKNVSAATREFSPRVGEEAEAEDHEVVGVLQAEGGSSASPMLDGKHWGPERSVEVRRDDKNSLGISIVGGKVDLSWSGSSVTGIFIKNVLPESPAGKGGHLKTGDRILEVEGKDLRGATHEKAVEVIKNTGNPVTFLVQSLVQWTPANSRPPSSRDVSRLGTSYPTSISPARTPTPELIQPGITDSKRQELQAGFNKPLSRRQTTEDSDGDPDDERYEQGRIDTKKGVEIDRASAGAIRRNKADRAADTEEEDEFGYTQKKIQKKYQDMKGEVVVVELEKGPNGLGISLAGNRDRTVMSAFVCGLNPSGNAYKDGRIKAGDEILEVNGNVVYGRCHLNASCIFKGIPGNKIKIIVVRKQTGLQEMAIKPITTFPATLEDETPEERYGRYKGMAHFVMKKGQGGLGIMIIEGKHAEYGNGIFISDLQEGSVAAEAGLLVGDMILCVNKEDMCGLDYDRATDVLKKTEGVINMYVANAARVAGAKKAKPDVPPKPAIAPKPAVPAKPASLSSLPPHAAAPVTPPQPPQPHTTTPLDDPATSTTDGPTPPPPPAAPRPVPTDRLTVHHTVTPVTSSASSVSSTSLSPPTSLPAVTEEKPQDPATAEIRPGKETTIEIIKEKMGLGLSIVGGSDTLLGAIIIHEVYPDGAAAKDGRLKPGDQILNVNTENFREITHQKALSVLRQTPSKVKMVVYREEGTQKEEDLYDTITVQLTKKAGKGLGLSIVGRKNGPGVFISDVVPGGVAEGDGRLMQGDQILEVNDTDLRAATQEQAAAILKCAPGSVSIKLGRLKAGKKANANNNANSTWPVTISDSTPDSPPTTPPAVPPVPVPRTHQPPHPLHHHHHHHHHHLPPPQPPQEGSEPLGIRTILLERRDDGLGFSIVGGFGSNLGDLPIYVKSVFERGAAAREGSLRRGDQILEVNGQSLAGLTHSDAVAILKEARGSVALTILPSK